MCYATVYTTVCPFIGRFAAAPKALITYASTHMGNFFLILLLRTPPSPKSPGPYLSLEGWYVWYNEEQVAQGQYVVSDTRCPALSDCELE